MLHSQQMRSLLRLLGLSLVRALCCITIFMLCAGVIFLIPQARTSMIRAALLAADSLPPSDALGRMTLLILGTGDPTHDGANLTDTVLFVRLDPGAQQATLLSIPRDLYIDVPGFPQARINELFAQRLNIARAVFASLPESATTKALDRIREDFQVLFGEPVDVVIRMDFTGFRRIIDGIDGIDLSVLKDIADYSFPLSETEEGPYLLKAGKHHFDGTGALRYARTRHGDSDFERSLRQQEIVGAVQQKIQSLSIIQRLILLRTMRPLLPDLVSSTLPDRSLIGLALLASQVRPERIVRTRVQPSPASPGAFVTGGDPVAFSGASVLIPISFPGALHPLDPLRSFVRFTLRHGSALVDPPVINVLAEPEATVQAKWLEMELRRYGFQDIELTEGHAGHFVWYTNRRYEETARLLGKLLSCSVLFDPRAATGSGADITVSINEQYRFRSFFLNAQID